MKKLMVGICNSQSRVPSVFLWSMLGQRPCGAELHFFRSKHAWDIVRNNQIIKIFLDSNCDYLAKCDVDQAYPNFYFQQMVPLVEKYKVIGPLIFDRWPAGNFMPLVNWSVDDWLEGKTPEHFDVRGECGIRKVDTLHTNCLYHREVLEKIPAPWYEAHATKDGLHRANHVDMTFMNKIKDVGYSLYINYNVEVYHMAEVAVGRDVYERWNQ